MEVENEENYFENTKYIINPTIHKFLYVLVKYLLLGKDYMKKTEDKLKKFITKSKIKNFNTEILIQNNCDSKSFEAILSFIKTHNSLLASEILENILIRVLSFSFNTKSDEFFGKYLYNNLSQFKKDNNIFLKWIEIGLINPLFNEDNKTLDFALENDDIELFEKKTLNKKRLVNLLLSKFYLLLMIRNIFIILIKIKIIKKILILLIKVAQGHFHRI